MSSHSSIGTATLLLGLAFLTLAAHADTAPPFSMDSGEFALVQQRYVGAQGTDLHIVRSSTRYLFREDGAYDSLNYSLMVIASDQGLQQIGRLGFAYRPWFEEPPEIRVRVYTGGKISNFDQTVESSIAQQGLIYGDLRVVHLQLEGVQIGSVIELEINQRQRRSAFPAGVNLIHPIQRNSTVEALEVIVSVPSGSGFKVGLEGAELEGLQTETEQQRDRSVFTFWGENVTRAPLAIDQQSPDTITHASIVVSTAKSWNHVARAYEAWVDEKHNLWQKKDVIERIGLQRNRSAQIKAVVDFVDRSVRYTSNDLGQSTLEPDSPLDVLARQYGDCKDQSTLMVSMFRHLGINANVALVSSDINQAVTPDYPGISVFNHAVVYLPDDDTWIDPSAGKVDLSRIPLAIQGRLALIVDNKSRSLVRTKTSTAKDNTFTRTVEVEYSDMGGAKVIDTRIFTGALYEAAAPLEGAALEATRSDIQNYVQTQLAGELEDFSVEDDPENSLLKIRIVVNDAQRYQIFRFGFAPATDASQALEFVPIQFQSGYPTLRSNLATASGYNAGETVEPETYFINLLSEYVYIERHTIPPYMKWTRFPQDLAINGPVMSFERTVHAPENTLEVRVTTAINKNSFDKQELEAERLNFRAIQNAKLQRLEFRSVPAMMIEEGRDIEAFELHRSLVAKHPDRLMPLIRYTDDLESVGLRRVANRLLLAAADQFSQHALYQNELGVNYLQGDFGELGKPGSNPVAAEIHLRQALALDPHDIYSLVGLSIAVLKPRPMQYPTPEQALSLALLIEDTVKGVMTRMKSAPGEFAFSDAASTIKTLARYGAEGYLIAKRPADAKRLIGTWGGDDESARVWEVVIESVSEGPLAAGALARNFPSVNTIRIIGLAVAELAGLNEFDAAKALLTTLPNPARSRQILESLDQAAKVTGCYSARASVPSEPASPDPLYGTSYPAELQAFVRKDPAVRRMAEAGIAVAKKEFIHCMSHPRTRELGNLMIVLAPHNQIWLRDADNYHFVGSILAPRTTSRVFDHLVDAGSVAEAHHLFDSYVDAVQGHSASNARLALFRPTHTQIENHPAFFQAMLHATAKLRSSSAATQLSAPPAPFDSARHQKALRDFLIDALPLTSRDEIEDLYLALFEDSDQFQQDWLPIFEFYFESGMVQPYADRLAQFTTAFGPESNTTRFLQAKLRILQGEHDELAKLLEPDRTGQKFSLTQANDIAWNLAVRNVELDVALRLLSNRDYQPDLRYAHYHTLATLYAAQGQAQQAFSTLRSGIRADRDLTDSDYFVLAIAAGRLGYPDFQAELIERLTESDSESAQILREVFTRN
ncbi:MAG: DUF3857 domain-containing protein [Pseudomonadota bacterium]